MDAGVAIIGAGVIGLAVALECLRAGIDDVFVIDGHAAPGQGSTSRANGGVRAQFTTPWNIAFSRFTIDGLADLDAVSDGLVGLHRIGYLFMTGTAEGERALRHAHAVQQACGLGVEWLDAATVAERVPFVRGVGLRAGTFCASDGVIDPHGVVMALWHEAHRLGLRALLDEPVVGIECRDDGATVRTSRSVIGAVHVVNAAGPAARAVAALAGGDLPVATFRRNLACTQPVSGLPRSIPMCVDLDTGVLVRREGECLLLGYANPADEPSDSTAFDPAFLEALAERVGNRFPFLETVAIDERKCWAGLYPETPDHNAIIGVDPVVPRLLHCAGFGGHGIMHSLAAGRAVAELLRDGRCSTFDLGPLRPERFAEGRLEVETAVL